MNEQTCARVPLFRLRTTHFLQLAHLGACIPMGGVLLDLARDTIRHTIEACIQKDLHGNI